MKAINIEWDIDDENELETLPTEIDIPSVLKDDKEAISDYLSDVTGFCHKCFDLVLSGCETELTRRIQA